MELGVVIPNGVAGVDGQALIEWSRRVEQHGFATVGVIGRIAYPAHEELVTLAAVAGATERVRLMSSILIGPVREPVLFAKQAATLDRLSNGRLVLGLGVGMRADDFIATGTTFDDRGNRFDHMLEQIHALWRGEPPVDGSHEASPTPVNGRIPIYFGTMTDAPRVMKRIAKWGDGYVAVGSPRMVEPIIEALRKAWDEEGREGKLRLSGALYFAFGDDAIAEGERNIRDYYADFFPTLGNAAAAGMIRTPEYARRILDVYEEGGFDEFNFSAASTDPSQVDRLAEAVL
jgi:alkanesulfonate monooxygenase SsuD/methylene tetrahydromethanopterin reductase-like flavin-dependent oxidoreductase (luciferase family)